MNVGILGAGQLGRMLALAGYPLDFRFVFLDPSREACAAPLGLHICADYADENALAELCARCDAVTYEFENVPASAAAFIAQRKPFYPPALALTVGQDRFAEKTLFSDLGIPVPHYLPVWTRQALDVAVLTVGLPAVLKTRRLGYDGKGQVVLKTLADVDAAWAQLGSHSLILEAFVPFEREVSVLGVRSRTGELAFYPLVENVHRDGILRTARPRPADPLQQQAENYTKRVLEKLDYTGVLAFEFFVAGGELLGNEIAPRVHNSGHWTIEGAQCSQFENHLRAVAGLPLGSTAPRGASAMVNFIGAAPDLRDLSSYPGLHVHLYSKIPKPQRKIGHATLTAQSEEELDTALNGLLPMIALAR